jgi:hypothetical protein
VLLCLIAVVMLGECLIPYFDSPFVLVGSNDWPVQRPESILPKEYTDDPYCGIWSVTADSPALLDTLGIECQTAVCQFRNWSDKVRTLHGATL